MTLQRTIAKIDRYEPVVQLDRTLPSEGKDRWFESNRVRQNKDSKAVNCSLAVFFCAKNVPDKSQRM